MANTIAFASEIIPEEDENSLFLIGEDGTQLWARTITDDATPPEAASMYAVAVDPSENVYTAGQTWIGVSTGPGVSKWDSSGTRLWNSMVSTIPPLYEFHSIAVAPNGDVIVGATRRDMGGGKYGTVFLLDGSDGSVLWYKDGGDGSAAYFVAADAAGNVYASMAYAIWSWEQDGTPRWTTGPYETWPPRGLAIDPTNTWVYVGYGTELIGRFSTVDGVEDTSEGWPIDLDIADDCYVADITCDEQGYLYVGYSFYLGTAYGVRKYAPDGSLIWDSTPATCIDIWDISVSSSGYVYVAGWADPPDCGGGFKLSAEDGTEVLLGWPKAFPENQVFVAASPGCVGAFPSSWPADDAGGGYPGAPPFIYVGNVLYE